MGLKRNLVQQQSAKLLLFNATQPYNSTFCITKLCKVMKNSIVISFRIDPEIQRYINYLKKNKVNHTHIIRETIKKELKNCNAYSKEKNSFVVASSNDTTHIEHININSDVAGNILLETSTVGKIQGVQFRAVITLLEDTQLKKLYFKTFPYALALAPKLWQIKVNYFKMTDNKLGFGKKIIWQESLD